MAALTSIFRIALAIAGLTMAASISYPGSAQESGRWVAVRNDCDRPVQLLVYHADLHNLPDKLHLHFWYKFDAAHPSKIRLRANGIALSQLEKLPFYYYAETTDAGPIRRWQGTGPVVTVQGATYHTTNADALIDEDGWLVIRLTCS